MLDELMPVMVASEVTPEPGSLAARTKASFAKPLRFVLEPISI
jgi:hypothetical protein